MNCTVRVNVKFRKLYTNLRIIKKICEQQLDRMSPKYSNHKCKETFIISSTVYQFKFTLI